ncbi:MAG: GntR family transcriptional regulator [Lachnospiraceae bacterium]|nr:GntR family transcriptional regulator [Lachnospiraceae bacterium]
MENELRITMDDYLPLRDVVFNTLRGAILRGDLKPGQRLMEIQLANQLGVSRTPVREAIRKLELEGLVKMVPRKGAEVAQISEKHLKDVLEVRIALEELAGELACDRMTSEELEELKQINHEFLQVIESDDITAIANVDEAFHMVIYRATGNERLSQMVNALREQIYRYRLEHIKDKAGRATLVKEHEEIIQALENRDEARTRKGIRCHIQEQAIAIQELLKRG